MGMLRVSTVLDARACARRDTCLVLYTAKCIMSALRVDGHVTVSFSSSTQFLILMYRSS